MKVIFGLRCLSATINPEVKEILELCKIDMPRLATASLGIMLRHILVKPYDSMNVDCFLDPVLYNLAPDLDEYVLDLQLRNNRLPYTQADLRHIFSEVCLMIYQDTYPRLKEIAIPLLTYNLSTHWYNPHFRLENVKCSFSLLEIDIYVDSNTPTNTGNGHPTFFR